MNIATSTDKLFYRIVFAFAAGILWGIFFPSSTPYLAILSSIFVKCIRLVVTPIIFFSLVSGICSQSLDKKGVRGLFIKTLLYFEGMAFIAILITFVVMLILRPGAGLDVTKFQEIPLPEHLTHIKNTTLDQFFLNIIPDSFLGAFVHDNLLSVLFLSVIFAIAVLNIPNNQPIIQFIDYGNRIFFQIIKMVVSFSPIATFAAISHAVAGAGLSFLVTLIYFFAAVVLSMALFCLFVGLIAHLYLKVNVLKMIPYFKSEYLLAFATSSSETVLPQTMTKLEAYGVPKKIVSFVLPMGYSFNLDGTAIYVAAGALFIQQAYGVVFTWSDYLTLMFILLFTSKGAAGVSGAGFITLSATLASIPDHPIPFTGLVLLLGIDRFMSDARTICNLTGNILGTLIIARSEGVSAEELNPPSQ